MYESIPHLLWIGHAGDLLKPAAIEAAAIKAVLQVALAEQMPQLSRELLFAHFPILDGSGTTPGVVAAAVDLAATLIRNRVPTLICCSAGMSRSPCIAAGALAIARNIEPNEALLSIISDRPHDISPALWNAVCEVVSRKR
jgi:protein-tyrosine phosphatase